ncbi:MAG TPA: GAF domain-containing sensor histidine kinase [Vicinamibacterales bacterium]|nr:GAF domain-containing sensor histidine kinase [Vicinamibacterales bacterium]
MRPESNSGVIARVLAKAAVIVVVAPAAAWLFLAGLRALPPLDKPADAVLGAAYSVAWMLVCVVVARAYQRSNEDRNRCREANRVAEQAERLAQLTAALAQARTPAAAIEAALQEPLHALRADAGLVLLLRRDGSTAEVARAVGYRPEERDARGEESLDVKTPATDAIGRGAPVLIESPSKWDHEYPSGARGEFGSVAAVPLLVGSRVVAVVRLEFRERRAFTTADRDYVQALAARGAQALDRTWQHESALSGRAEADAQRQRAERELVERQKVEAALRASEARYRALVARTTRLHGLAAALSEAATLDHVARAVVQHGRNVLGAASGDVAMLVDGGTAFETVFADGPRAAGPSAREAAVPGLCATEAVHSRAPVLVSSFDEWQERYARSATIAADGGYVSSATLPLLVDGVAVGVLGFHFTNPVNFDDDYRDLLVSVARHCAQAVERARLYEAADRARADAETANRHKDELVSIVSHELRTPLNAIIGWTSMLQQGALDEQGIQRALQSIADNASRQLRLVEDLLDFSRLQSGRMSLDAAPVDLRALLREVIESIIPVAASGGIHLDVSPVPDVHLTADPRRLEQIFLNLLGNALKFTPEGGRVAVAVDATDAEVCVRITDTGPGIDPDFLPHIFEAFRQSHAASRHYGGAGLGLSIAKELVEAHKGRIAAESPGIGRGATFVVTLPTVSSAEQEAVGRGPASSAAAPR